MGTPANAPLPKQRVLLVDDDPDIALGTRIRLQAAGYDVEVAGDGVAGFDRALGGRPDIIVLDLRMPRRDGFAMLADVRSHETTREIPVIVISANGIEESRQRALELGAQYYLRKPYDPQTLVQAIEETLSAA